MSDPPTVVGGGKVGGGGFLAAVLQTVAQPIWVVDADGLIRFANPAAIAALGYDSADELLGRPSHETIHHSHPDGTPFPVAECPMLLPRTTGQTVSRDSDWFFRRDGSMFRVSYVSAPIDVARGPGAIVAFTDIDGRRDVVLGEEQAAARRVAALVAGGADSGEVFAAVAREVAQVLGVTLVVMSRYDADGSLTVIGSWSERPHSFQTGTRWPLEGPTVSALVRDTGRPVRVERYEDVEGAIAEAVRGSDMRAAAGAPIIVDGEVWGVIAVASRDADLPEWVEERLAGFTELVGTAISNTEARDELRRLAEEQAALRRVATRVADGEPPADVFAAVAREIARLLHTTKVVMCRYEPDDAATAIGAAGDHPFCPGTTWPLDGPSMLARVRATGRPARIDDYSSLPGAVAHAVRTTDANAGVSAPITVDGEVWGVISVGADSPLPSNTEDRLSQFTDLVAMAVSKTQAREELRQLAKEQAALRRLATLVAEGAEPRVVFDAVAEETGRLLGATTVNLAHFTPDAINVTMSGWSLRGVHVPPGMRLPIDGDSINALVLRTAQPGRCDTYEGGEGVLAARLRRLGIRSEVGAPVVVEGHVWGGLFAGTDDPEPLPPGTEHRLAEFAELIATAVSNAQARQDLRRLVDEQGALRRIATAVADGAESQLVFDAVCEETGRLFGAATVNLVHFTPDDFHLAMAGWSLRGVHVPAGTLLPLEGDTIDTLVQRTAAPGRCDSYEHARGEIAALLRELGVRCEVGAPVVVDGAVWGALIAGTDEPEPLPPGTEYRLAKFAELIATAVSNATARTELIASRARIVSAADEQRRRVVRDLHDGAQQRLVHAVITLQLAVNRSDAPPEVDSALEHLEAAIEELRELAHGIHPALLTSRGLGAAVEALAERAPLPVTVDITEERYATQVESAAYFVAAEALTNVAKYARAHAATVTATRQREHLVLAVADDGVGGAAPAPGSGLTGLADRVAALAGTLVVESPPGAGTRVRAEIPLG